MSGAISCGIPLHFQQDDFSRYARPPRLILDRDFRSQSRPVTPQPYPLPSAAPLSAMSSLRYSANVIRPSVKPPVGSETCPQCVSAQWSLHQRPLSHSSFSSASFQIRHFTNPPSVVMYAFFSPQSGVIERAKPLIFGEKTGG